MKKKKETWRKPHHQPIISIALPFLDLYTRCTYHIKVENRRKDKRQYLILFNHQTAFDQFLCLWLFIGQSIMWLRKICFPKAGFHP